MVGSKKVIDLPVFTSLTANDRIVIEQVAANSSITGTASSNTLANFVSGYIGSGPIGYTGSRGVTGFTGSASSVAGPTGPTGFTGSGGSYTAGDANLKPIESMILAASDETTAITSGTDKITFRLPYNFTVTEVLASLNVAQASGSILTVDINKNGTSILSTKLTIDNTEDDSFTATTPAVISTSTFSKRDKVSIDVDQIGNGTAIGLKVTLVGYRT